VRRYKKDDELARTAKLNLYKRIKQLAQEADVFHPYQYMNYADGDVDVFEGYGKEQRDWLRKVKASVVGKDRWNVGGFKV
jgi:hypothetical protein